MLDKNQKNLPYIMSDEIKKDSYSAEKKKSVLIILKNCVCFAQNSVYTFDQ